MAAPFSDSKQQLIDELRQLEEDEEFEKEEAEEERDHSGASPEPTVNMSPDKKSEASLQYYEKTLKRLEDYAENLRKRNELQSKNLIKSQIINAYLEDSEYPFEAIFQESINQVKEEVADRKNENRKNGICVTKSISRLRKHAHEEALHLKSTDRFGKQSPREQLTADTVKPHHLIESDKRRLMSLFLQSEDILYFTYGLLYP